MFLRGGVMWVSEMSFVIPSKQTLAIQHVSEPLLGKNCNLTGCFGPQKIGERSRGKNNRTESLWEEICLWEGLWEDLWKPLKNLWKALKKLWKNLWKPRKKPLKTSENLLKNLSKPLKNLWKPSLSETLSERPSQRQISSQRLWVLLPLKLSPKKISPPPPCRHPQGACTPHAACSDKFVNLPPPSTFKETDPHLLGRLLPFACPRTKEIKISEMPAKSILVHLHIPCQPKPPKFKGRKVAP